MKNELYFRGTGRSTCLAFETIAKAMRNPGSWIDAIDHYPTHQANIKLVRLIENIIASLELKGFCTMTGPICAKIQFNLRKV